MAEADAISHSSGTKSLFKSGKYSGMMIMCRGYIFNVHKAVVCPQSDFFAKSMDGGFKEAATSQVDLVDDEPEIVAHMLSFRYTGDYDSKYPAPLPPSSSLAFDKPLSALIYSTNVNLPPRPNAVTDVKVYVIGDKYNIPGLRKLAGYKYEIGLGRDMQDFILSLEVLYENTVASDRLLKRNAMNVVGRDVGKLINDESFTALCKRNSDIAIDIVEACAVVIENFTSDRDKKKFCTSCGRRARVHG